MFKIFYLIFVSLLITSCSTTIKQKTKNKIVQKSHLSSSDNKPFNYAIGIKKIDARLDKFAPVVLEAQGMKKNNNQVKLIKLLVQASKFIDAIYWKQISPNSKNLYEKLISSNNEWYQKLGHYMAINYGPWDRFNNNEPFIGSYARPEGANFYPEDISKNQIEQWLNKHPDDKNSFFSPYTAIRRNIENLTAIPYSQLYKNELSKASKKLKEAAKITSCEPLKKFLTARADSFLNNNYYESELLWLATIKCDIDITIGPYEYYEDKLLGFKTAFESIIYLINHKASSLFVSLGEKAKLILKDIAQNRDFLKKVKFNPAPPVTIADVIYTSGDAKAGFQISAFMLPNDEKVLRKKGSKNVIFKNVVDAKFKKIIIPMVDFTLNEKLRKYVDGNAYFDFLLLWEVSHIMQPKAIIQGKQSYEIKRLLRERYTIIQAAYSDAVSLLLNEELVKQGLRDKKFLKTMPVAYLLSMFNSFRYGQNNFRAFSKLLLYNYFIKNKALVYNARTKLFNIDFALFDKVLSDFFSKINDIYLNGNYSESGLFIMNYGRIPGEIQAKSKELDYLPIDILPIYKYAPKISSK